MRKAAVSWSLFGIALPGLAAAAPDLAARATADHVTVELVAENNSLQPGSRAWVGLKITHEPHWHTYWMNPGDSGLPTRLEWQLPSNFRAGEIAWVAPQRFDIGDLYNFGYDGTVMLPVPIDVPANTQPNQTAQIGLTAKWLVCNDVCIPGKASLALGLPIANSGPIANANTAALFARARAAQPSSIPVQGQAVAAGDRVTIEIRGLAVPSSAAIDAFPTTPKLLTNTPFKIARNADRLVLTAQKSEYFESAPATLSLVVVQKPAANSAGKAWQLEMPWKTERASAAK